MAFPLKFHRITKPYFRTCSTRRCRSQAPFCLCTLRMVSNHSEGTFGRLRYPFGGDRPSQTPPPDIVPRPVHGLWLETQHHKGGIPTAAPCRLASTFPSLPPILYMQYRVPVSSWSKAPWGLSVLARVASIFTGTSIFTGCIVETAPKSLRLSCGSELTRQGISLP